MKQWGTFIYAKCPKDGQIKTYCGPLIPAPSKQLAIEYCETNGLGYCHVSDEVVMEIPCIPGTLEPDWGKATDHEKPQLN